MAIAYFFDDVADLLIANGAMQNIKNNNGQTPWDLTSQ